LAGRGPPGEAEEEAAELAESGLEVEEEEVEEEEVVTVVEVEELEVEEEPQGVSLL
jgi:hypothetical protein